MYGWVLLRGTRVISQIHAVCRSASRDVTCKRTAGYFSVELEGCLFTREFWNSWCELSTTPGKVFQLASLPGVPRVILARSRVARCLWVFVCLSCTSMFIIGAKDLLRNYFSYPKKVSNFWSLLIENKQIPCVKQLHSLCRFIPALNSDTVIDTF